jgi:hypothetical protein
MGKTFDSIAQGLREAIEHEQRYSSMKKVIRVVSLKNQPSDYEYWLSRPVAERLDAIEALRRQYLEFTKNVEPRLQRVCRVIKPA